MSRRIYGQVKFEILANIWTKDAMSYSDICKAVGISTGGQNHPGELVERNELQKKDYVNVTLYFFPNTPLDVVESVWRKSYKPGTKS